MANYISINILQEDNRNTELPRYNPPTFQNANHTHRSNALSESAVVQSIFNTSGNLLSKIPIVKAKCKAELDSQYQKFCNEWNEKFEKFGKPIEEIPEEGWSKEQLLNLISRYSNLTNTELANKLLSGTVYLNTLNTDSSHNQANESSILNQPALLAERTSTLTSIFVEAFKVSQFWNPLHSDEFGIGPFINHQIIRMVANMFGGTGDEIKGFVTSGGTESLMQAARSYRNWGKRTKGIAAGESVIIAPDTFHAALLKAGEDYEIKIKLARTDSNGVVDIDHLKDLARKNKDNLVAIFASAPSYKLGTIDDIKRIAKIANYLNCGMHVDCCLGGFIVNHIYENTDFLTYPGVTSLSCDTHKNGLATKGSSVLVTKPLGEYNLAFDSVYAFPNWACVYATPTMAGSQSSVPAFTAMLAMLCVGKEGYRTIAQTIKQTLTHLTDEITDRYQGKIRIAGLSSVNVLGIQMGDQFRNNAIYGFVHFMKDEGVIFNALKGQLAHFCLTWRFCSDEDMKERFLSAMQRSLEKLEKMNESDTSFPGEGSIYGTLQEVYDPSLVDTSIGTYLENKIFGRQVAEDAVRLWVTAGL